MPARWFSWAIVSFWLAMTGWLFYREILPRFQTGRPPRWEAAFGDEVRTTVAHWTIFLAEGRIGSPDDTSDRIELGSLNRTWLKPRKDRTFEFGAEFNFGRGLPLPLGVRLVKFVSIHRTDPTGELRGGLRTEMTLLLPGAGTIDAVAKGKVERGQFSPVLKVHGLGRTIILPLEPVAVSAGDAFFNPMQPLNKGPLLKPGRRWRLHVVNPLNDALVRSAARVSPLFGALLPLFKSQMIEELEAEVAEGTLRWKERDQACWVIDYRPPGKSRVVARTWVRRSDRLVLRQEAEFMGRRLVMTRNDSPQ